MVWRPKGNGNPKSWFSDIPHWELRVTSADGSTSKRLFPQVDYDPAEDRYWREERDREWEQLEEAHKLETGSA